MFRTFKTIAILTNPLTIFAASLGAVGVTTYVIGRWLYRELGPTKRRPAEQEIARPQVVVVPAPPQETKPTKVETLVEQAAQAVAAPSRAVRTRKPRPAPQRPKSAAKTAKPSPAKARAKPKTVKKAVTKAKKPIS
jgi:hypothetical protein